MNTSTNATTVKISTMAKIAAMVPAVEYNPKWANGTGYMDGAVREAIGPVGTTVSSVCPSGRLILIHATRHGNIVLFEHTTGSEIVVSNHTNSLNAMVNMINPTGNVFSSEAIESIVGMDWGQLRFESSLAGVIESLITTPVRK